MGAAENAPLTGAAASERPEKQAFKVCHMTSGHPAEDQRIFHKECVSLAKAGYGVYLVQQGGSYEKNGVHIVGFGEMPKSRLKRMAQTARRVYRAALAVDADIYHFHEPELLPYGLKLKKRGKKVIFDSHELYVQQIRAKEYLPGWSRALIAGAYGVYERHVLRTIDGVIFPCKIEGRNPFEGRCRRAALINNVPRLDEFYDRYSEAVPKRERSIVYVGGLTHNRGVTHLVKSAAKAGCTAWLGGTFSPASYQAEMESLPEYSHVRYLGQLSRSQVAETLQSCQIGMAALLNVGQYGKLGTLATKVYEYMSLGLPVVLSSTPYNTEAVERCRFGICADPEDTESIAAAITYLLDHPEEARRMGENGRKAVKEEFNWGVEEKKLLALYEDILKE